MVSFLHSREGVMQGDPLAMMNYIIGVLPLIKQLKSEYPDVTQPWFTDNAGALGTFNKIEYYLNLLIWFGPGRGYYPKPLKIILIVHPKNPASGKDFGLSHGLKICTGAEYLGGFIGDKESKPEWLKDRTSMWEKNIRAITKVSGKFPQESHTVAVHAIHSELIYLQHTTKDTGQVFVEVKKFYRKPFYLIFSLEDQNIFHPL